VVRYDDPEYVRRFGAAERSRAFGPVAAAYERGRPGYPDEAVRWAVGRNSGTVLDLGAGTGKLTRTLAALGYDTIAVEPDDAMRAVIRETSPSTRALSGWAELIPLPAASVDAVVVAQAWHWFDHARAAAEVARVVRPGGHVALLYNIRDERIPWVARFAGATGERFGARRGSERSRTASSTTSNGSRSTTSWRWRGPSASSPSCRTTSGARWSRRSRRSGGAPRIPAG
jgi:SAM-dependent methyltransferase